MADPGDDEVERQLAALPARPAAERVSYLLELGWSRPGRPAPGIERFLSDPELVVRIAAAQARWQTEADPAEADRLVEIFVAGLGDDDEDLALMAGTALVNMGEAAVPALVRAFDAGEPPAPLIVRVAGEIAGDEAVRFLERASRSDDPRIAEEAREALEELAEEGEL